LRFLRVEKEEEEEEEEEGLFEEVLLTAYTK